MPSARWYLQRLSVMSPGEIPHRAWRTLRTRLEARRPWPAADDLSPDEVCGARVSTDLLRDLGRRFPPRPSRAELDGWPQEDRERCLADAEKYLNHQLPLFALRDKPLGTQIDFNRDYSTNTTIGLEPAGRIDYRDVRVVGDVKYVWELGRMQPLVRLAQAWRYCGDDRYAEEITAQISAFTEQCPYMQGVQWVSPMEAALRLISWTWAVHLIGDWSGIEDAFLGRLLTSIHRHLSFIDRTYSRFSSANNHLIAEAAGAYVAASYWDCLNGSRGWHERARRHLLRECLRQNWPDGVNKEQAFGYQFFVWDLLVIAALSGRAAGDEFPAAYWDRLERMVEFMAWVNDREGHTPDVGDRDDGIVVDLGQDRARPVMASLGVAASVFHRDDFRTWARQEGARAARWLVNSTHVQDDAPRPTTTAPRPSRWFPDGGYYVFRDASATTTEALLLFDVGPLGWPATAAHAHADALSIVLSLGGECVLVDPGTFSYQDTPRRRSDRGTARHNTLSFAGDDQAEYLNRFFWGRRPKVAMMREDTNGTDASFAAQVRWWTGAMHRRRVDWMAAAGRIIITDSWRGSEPPAIYFCVAPGLRVEVASGGVVIRGQRCEVRLVNSSGTPRVKPTKVSRRCYVDEDALSVCFQMAEVSGQTTTEISWTFEHDE